MVSREVPKDVKELVDMLGQAFVQALVTDEAGKGLLKRIQERGFEVGILVEATVALHSKCEECDAEGAGDGERDEALDMPDRSDSDMAGIATFPRASRLGADPDMSEIIRSLLGKTEKKDFEWSEEDRAMLCNFRISLD